LNAKLQFFKYSERAKPNTLHSTKKRLNLRGIPPRIRFRTCCCIASNKRPGA